MELAHDHEVHERQMSRFTRLEPESAVEQILRVLGKTEEEIEAVRARAAERAHFDKIFGS